MASVTSLDKDLRRLRLDKYTPAAANEARAWVEEALGQKLSSSDLLEGLKDGVALCKLVNLGAPPPGIRFKQSTMPFVQMENIAHFLRACQAPPFNLHQHDMFLTVDLYEQKDPAQVLQCLGAFSRAAHAANPSRFPEPIGFKNRTAAGHPSPRVSEYASPTGLRGRGASVTSNSSSAPGARSALPPRATRDATPSGRRSRTKSATAGPASPGPASPGPVSSWSRRELEQSTVPAWNIAQYGYMGGASQGNLGISFGGLRQITSAGPHVPSLAEKERKRRLDEAARQEEEERQRRAQLEAEEVARQEEERKWEEETQRLHEEERRKAQEEKQRWEEQERQWKLAEEKRRTEEREAAAKLEQERKQVRGRNDARLQGQLPSQHQAEQAEADRERSTKSRELEKELERARLREEEYERERQTRSSSRPVSDITPGKPRSRSRHRRESPSSSIPAAVGPQRGQSRFESWTRDDEREYIQNQQNNINKSQQSTPEPAAEPQLREPVGFEAQARIKSPRPLPKPARESAREASPQPRMASPRPLPEVAQGPARGPSPQPRMTSPRPLPEPARESTRGPSPQPQPRHDASSSFEAQPPTSPRPLPLPQPNVTPRAKTPNTSTGEHVSPSPRPLPDPAKYASPPPPPWQTRTDRLPASKTPPAQTQARQTCARELDATAERDAEDRRRVQSQAQTKAGGWASKSLLEREMEMERRRQQEWEEAQKETAKAVRSGDGVDGIGGGIGGRWDVGQWSGYTGGDSQNRGSQGIGSARRQIAGPRPLPGSNR